MTDTDMRPTEANNLKWGDYQLWYKHEDETTYIRAPLRIRDLAEDD